MDGIGQKGVLNRSGECVERHTGLLDIVTLEGVEELRALAVDANRQGRHSEDGDIAGGANHGERRAQTGSSLPAGLEMERRAISSLKYTAVFQASFFSGGRAVVG